MMISRGATVAVRHLSCTCCFRLHCGVIGTRCPGGGGRSARTSGAALGRSRSPAPRGDASKRASSSRGHAERIDAVAARHGLRIQKRLFGGAVVNVPEGALDRVTRDAALDQVSGNHVVQSQVATVSEAVGADLAATGFAAVRGVTGQGIGIAIIDSGIANVPELRARVVASHDFTDDRGRGIDRFGHGTHVAGIASAIAPDVDLISLKVLDEEGTGTAGDVIQAIDWAVENRRRYRIKVINMSLGGAPMQSWREDPLCKAVQRAHDAGIVVVASAGNVGKTEDGTPVLGGVTVPGSCPHSLTVGALDGKGTTFRSDDEVATFSSKGPTRFDRLVKPDLVAPGRRVRSLLAPGSTLAQRYPEKVIGSGRSARLELSGTSMSAAVVSGAVALVSRCDAATDAGRDPFAAAERQQSIARTSR